MKTENEQQRAEEHNSPSVEKDSTDNATGKRPRVNPLAVAASVMAAGLGVQSSKNRERDFKEGRAGIFIFAGLLFTVLFIGVVYMIVSVVLSGR
ncbi:MAG: hypothetical protein ACI87W_003347 [Halieaceae bacterium]